NLKSWARALGDRVPAAPNRRSRKPRLIEIEWPRKLFAPTMNHQCDRLRAIHKVTDRDAFVRLMGLSRIARAEIDRRRASQPGRQTDVAVGAETGQPRFQPRLRSRALKRSDERMVS